MGNYSIAALMQDNQNTMPGEAANAPQAQAQAQGLLAQPPAGASGSPQGAASPLPVSMGAPPPDARPGGGSLPDGSPASFWTHVKTGFVDNPQTKLNIYANDRFPGITPDERASRYGYILGEPTYRGDDGQLYPETPDNLLPRITRTMGEFVPSLPSATLGAVGAWLGGAPGAGVGSAIGEGTRKAVGGLAFDEPQTVGDYLKGMGTEAALGAGGDLLGKGAHKLLSSALAKRGGPLVRAAGEDLPKINMPDALGAYNQGQRYGIDLFPPQITESPQLTSKFSLLGDLPRTSPVINAGRQAQQQQVQSAVYDFLDTVAPSGTNSLGAGKQVVGAANDAIDGLARARSAAASPLYEAARNNAGPVDTSAALQELSQMVDTAPRGGKGTTALRRVERMLMREETNAAGERALVPETRLDVLDNVKKEIDLMLSGPDSASIHRDTLRRLGAVRDHLVGAMDAASPEYGQARQVFAQNSPPVDAARKGLAGQVADLEGDKVIDASRRLFSSAFSSQETVREARRLIAGQNPEAWDAALRVYLQDAFEGIKQSMTGGTTNLGGAMRQKLFGDEQQRAILRSAMTPEQYTNLSDFMEVLRRTGIGLGKESTTAARQESIQDMRKAAGSTVARSVLSPRETLLNAINDGLFGKYQDRLAAAMLSPDSAQAFLQMKRLPAGSRQLMEAVGSFLGAASGDETGRIWDRFTQPDTANSLRQASPYSVGALMVQ